MLSTIFILTLWSISLNKEAGKWIKKFIWSSDFEKSKLVIWLLGTKFALIDESGLA
jgi:hypothetical protein